MTFRRNMSGSDYLWIFTGISFMMTSGALAGHLLYNLALNQQAVQSSTSDSVGLASKAVDGKRDSGYQTGSCTLTNLESNPWWRVDLGNVYTIGAVMITNRAELENGLDGAELWIGNSIEINDTESMRCAVVSHIPSGQTLYFPCRPLHGRYVTVSLPGSGKVLSLCEVEVYYGYSSPNVALKGEATQSSTLSFAAASKAIDGRRNSFYSNGSCSHTAEDETDPWWRVDLQQSFQIAVVKITNRGDCCAERLDGAEIRIGNSLENNGNNNPRCASISHINTGKTYTYQCDGGTIEGRFVNVFLPGKKKTLTLCEVEVYAAQAVGPLPNVALNRPSAQSSTLPGYVPSKANDGCANGNLFSGCCSHTSDDLNAWWRVDLLAVHKVAAVTIINRQDCCGERLFGAHLLIGNSLAQNGSQNPICGTIPSQNTPTNTFYCNGMEGRYITVIRSGGSLIPLALCEVEVFASPSEVVTPSPSSSPSPPPASPTLTVLLGSRNITVVAKRLCWSDALMYCRQYDWDLLSIHSQQEQSELEQLLGSVPFSLTDYVWLGLRRTLRGDDWFWMSGHSMDFFKWQQDVVPYCYSSTCGGMASSSNFFWQDHPCEEELNFICESDAGDGAQRVFFSSTKNDTYTE